MESDNITEKAFTSPMVTTAETQQSPKHTPCYEDNILHSTVNLTPIFYAVYSNDVKVLNMLMRFTDNFCSEEMFGYTPLALACKFGHKEIATALIKCGADLSVKTENRSTLLHLAVEGNSMELVQVLLEKELDINSKTGTQETPLFYPVFMNNYNMVKLLIENGCDVNVTCTSFRYSYKMESEVSPLVIAALNGNFEMVQLLTKSGATIDFKKDGIFTPLHAACNSGCIKSLKHFLNSLPDYNIRNRLNLTPLHYAVDCGHTEVVKHLLSLDFIEYDVQGDNGYTPFLLACAKGVPEIVQAFLDATFNNTGIHEMKKEYGIRTNVAVNSLGPVGFLIMHEMLHKIIRNLFGKDYNIHRKIKDGRIILDLATEHARYDLLKLILKYGGYDVNMKDKKGWTALHYASYTGCLTCLYILLKLGLNVNAKTNTKSTPLHLAINRPNSERVVDVALYLLSRDADINAIDEIGWTALHYAVKQENGIVVPMLLKSGANINCQEMEYLKAPIHVAVQIKSDCMLQVLIKHGGADLNIKMSQGLTAVHQAAHLGNLEAVKILIVAGGYYDVKGDSARSQPIHFSEYNSDIQEFLQLHQKLFEAVKSNDTKTIRVCLNQGAIINCRSNRYKTPLICSVFRGCIEMTIFLINIGANVNVTIEGNTTALHYAVKFNHFAIMCALLENGAQYDIVTSDGMTPLNMAQGAENFKINQLLQTLDDLYRMFKTDGPNKVHHQLLKLKRIKSPMEFSALLGSCNSDGQRLKLCIPVI